MAGAQCFFQPVGQGDGNRRLLGLRAEPEPRLIEMDWGEWEGRTLSDLRAEVRARPWPRMKGWALISGPPGGESPRDVQDRLRPFLAALGEADGGHNAQGRFCGRCLRSRTGWTMQSKAPQKLGDGLRHSFLIAPGGSPAVQQLSIPLTGPA
jgi:probable phosphoglycerate mutase